MEKLAYPAPGLLVFGKPCRLEALRQSARLTEDKANLDRPLTDSTRAPGTVYHRGHPVGTAVSAHLTTGGVNSTSS